MNIGDRIKKKRNEKSLTQKELGRLVNVSAQVISNWERGYTHPDYDDLARLSEALHCSSDYLLGMTDNPKNKQPKENQMEDDDYQEFMKDPLSNIMFDNWVKMNPEQRKEALRMIKYLRHREKMDEDI